MHYFIFKKKVKKEVKDEEEEKKPITVPPSTLDERIQKLIELICNVQDMENLLKEMKYDIKKAPLGKSIINNYILLLFQRFIKSI